MSMLLIEASHQQGRLRRFVQSGITLILWALWIYLLLPLFIPMMIAVGIQPPAIISTASPIHPSLFFAILIFVSVTMLGMLLWTRYNTSLHHHRTNRQDPLNIVCKNDLANYFNVSPKKLADWHCSEQLTIQLTKQGGIHCVAVSEQFNLTKSVEP
jgi:poly-beta-1,6-N-acetyl-D-glucosamine biosynthesis protein PgaD